MEILNPSKVLPFVGFYSQDLSGKSNYLRWMLEYDFGKFYIRTTRAVAYKSDLLVAFFITAGWSTGIYDKSVYAVLDTADGSVLNAVYDYRSDGIDGYIETVAIDSAAKNIYVTG